MGVDAPFWRFSTVSYPDLEGNSPDVSMLSNKSLPIVNDVSMLSNKSLPIVNEASNESRGDVYPMESSDESSVNQVIDAHWGYLYDGYLSGPQSYTICMLVNDTPGVLNLITGVISQQGYNVQSLVVGPAKSEGLSFITTVVLGTDETIGKLVKQFYKVAEVHEVQDITHLPFAERELMLIKVVVNAAARRDVLDIASISALNLLMCLIIQ